MAYLVYSSTETNLFQLLRLEHIVCANDKLDGQVEYESVLKPRTILEIHLMSFMRTQYNTVNGKSLPSTTVARRTFKSNIEH